MYICMPTRDSLNQQRYFGVLFIMSTLLTTKDTCPTIWNLCFYLNTKHSSLLSRSFPDTLYQKKGTGGIPQQLRALAILSEDPCLCPSTNMVTHLVCYLAPSDMTPSFVLHGHCTHMMHIYIWAHTHTHKIFYLKINGFSGWCLGNNI